jgi:hypothetical protein
MATSNAPARVPDRQPELVENANVQARQAGWVPEKKPSRFVIKVGGIIPT